MEVGLKHKVNVKIKNATWQGIQGAKQDQKSQMRCVQVNSFHEDNALGTVHSTLTEVSQAAPAAPGSPGLVQVSCLTRTDLLSSVALEALVEHKQTTMTNTMLLYNTKCQKPLSKSRGRQQNR